MSEPKKLLIKILECIDFEGKKDEYADSLLEFIFEDAIYEAIQSLPAARRKSVAIKWDKNENNAAALKSLLEHNFSEKQLSEAAEKAAEKAINGYLNSIKNSLTIAQKEKLEKLFEEFGQSL